MPPANAHVLTHRLAIAWCALLGLLTAALVVAAPALGSTLPAGFQESVAFNGLDHPTDVRFSPDGRVFVAEKSGQIKVFDSLTDSTPTVFADLRTEVDDYWDRGLLSIALPPSFPSDPSVYALYTYDAPIGGTAPVWNDGCPTPPGPTTDGCVVSGRLSKLQAAGNVMSGSEQVLIEDWCQQFPSHSIGMLEFGADGALYVSGGDGAAWNFTDYGQRGTPTNPCGDPPVPPGSTQAPPSAEGGALRSQDVRSSSDPTGLNGAILRLDPSTGLAHSGNPMILNPDPNARRIIAYGLRNPFRFTMRPGTSEIWVGDVGWDTWEEINVVANPADSLVENFGWPCYEGSATQPGYDGANLTLCESLYAQPSGVTAPYYKYRHIDQVIPGESCPAGSGSSLAGLSFEFGTDGSYPAAYDDALFFADYSRDCIWAMLKGTDGRPTPGKLTSFVSGAANPVNLRMGPGGDLFYVDFDGGAIRRVTYVGATNQAPTARAGATPASGPAPLSVTFGSARSTDPEGQPLAFAWDLDGDGAFDDSTSSTPTFTYSGPGTTAVRLRVSDPGGATGTDTISVVVGPDIAQGLPATASSVYGAGYEATKANDGSSTTRWSSAFSDNQWWQVDLGTARTVSAVSLNWETAYAARYQIQTSTDGTNFTAAADEQISAPGWRATTFPARTARYVRIVGIQRATVWGISFFDARVYGASGNAPPVPSIDAPTASTSWAVGDVINFSGGASDAEDGALPPSALSWTLIMNHCPSTCHQHTIQSWTGVASGQFTAPDHEYPSSLDLRLTATDSAGATATTSVTLQPKTVSLGFASTPTGLQIVVNSATGTTPFSRTVIQGSANTVSATSPQTLGGTTYTWSTWSDGGAQTHTVTATASGTRTATFTASGDATPPTLTGRSPSSGATGVLIQANVVATFSEPMSVASVTGQTFFLTPEGTATPVPATITANATRTQFTLNPSGSLRRNARYTATITTGVRDDAGNTLAETQTWSFRTGNR